MSSAVRRAGGSVCLCDTQAFPGRTRISFDGARVTLDGRRLPANIVSAYVRSLGVNIRAPEFARDLKMRPHGLLAQLDECGALLTSLLLCLREHGIPLVNGPEANSQHSRKPYQLQLLRDAGLPVPRFLASNDPKSVKDFVRTVRRAVYKPLAGGATVHEVLRKDLTRERLASLSVAPVLFQELVEGVSVRVYVVGGKAVAAGEIHSTELDYRRHEDKVVATTLSAVERRAAVKAAKVCGMRFSGVDLIRTRRGFVVLECNPSPMFAVFEEKTGLDVAGPLAAFLMAPR
ncbi:MAG: ATP-grasp domain-containing protein [Candidatus Hydrogenedentes bacterium]|nr:ATP-grasp domain-containing protein [Candidatus Hydrogenedentota bacterium]